MSWSTTCYNNSNSTNISALIGNENGNMLKATVTAAMEIFFIDGTEPSVAGSKGETTHEVFAVKQ